MHNPIHTHGVFTARPNWPGRPRAIGHPACGPVHVSTTLPVRSSTTTRTISSVRVPVSGGT
jgi:hypothetical protein